MTKKNKQDPRPDYRDVPKLFPPAWAVAYGQDNSGFWADFQVERVVQRMRWIPAGWFLMGSPEDEKERLSSETPHEVTLTQGYWLADTACTQELWQVVMGDNPSYFKEDPQNPVERVSWDDSQGFLNGLNGSVAGLNAGLPTEAQWEYACRAGRASPFSFGENINTEQVNYDGNFPYAEGEEGEYRKKTVPVKALAANSWGLYQMHGNVWEWCQDGYGDYPAGPVQDPLGAEEGEFRVMRGGSWVSYGLNVRSAYRFRYSPDLRDSSIGLRFSLGQVSSEALAEGQAR